MQPQSSDPSGAAERPAVTIPALAEMKAAASRS